MLAATALAGVNSAHAQSTGATGTAAQGVADARVDKADPGEQIVVTGSRIARPNLDSPSPITSLTAAELTNNTGAVSLGDILNQLPSLGSTFSQSNSTRFIGTAGLNILDLRRLGTARTLVLINGRRQVTSQPGVESVDVNTIPTDLVERVDIVTGGDSAVYGSDAVAGVVNFITKQNYQGIEAHAQGGAGKRGDRGSYFGSIVAGKNFSEGRGNIAAAFEYTHQDALYYTDRDDTFGAFSGAHTFTGTENTIGEPPAGDGIPDNSFLTGLRFTSISEGGLYTSFCPALPATGTPSAALLARRATNCTGLFAPSAPGTPIANQSELGNGFAFDPSGNLVLSKLTRDLRPFGSSYSVGGLGSTLLLTSQLDPGVTQYATNMMGHYEVSPALRFFAEGKYVKVNAEQAGQPTFFNNSFSTTNPYLSDQARGVLAQSLAPGATSFRAFRFNTDFGGRGEDHSRELYRIVAGINGNFLDTWKYELSFNYGHLDTFYATRGNVITAKFANSRNAVRNTSGQIVCGINADAITTNDDPACVPVNLFGQGAPSPQALNYFGYTSTRKQHADQYDALGSVSGDSSKLFSLPGGPIAFAFGAEYRRETAYSKYDDLTASGATFLNSIPTFAPPALEVIDGFAEVRLPLLKDRPFFHELSVEAAARVSNYNIGKTGTVWTYNVGGTWAPVNDLRIRASYAVSVRAPTQSDLFATPSQTFLNGLSDPCSSEAINNNPNRKANCAAAGVPATQLVNGSTQPFSNVAQSGISGLNGSNPNLSAEEGTSYTIGGILTPRWIRGLTLSVDYYNIEIKNVIFTLAPQTIINQCYDSPSGINNQYCAAVFRNPDGTFKGQRDQFLGGMDTPLPGLGASFLAGPFNFAKQKTSGIDADLTYTHRVDADFSFTLRGLVSYLINRDNYTDIGRPNYLLQQKLNLGDPEWKASVDAGFSYGVFDFNYQFRYIGRMTIGAYEAQNSVQGRPPENADQYPVVFYPDITYSNVRVGITVDKKYRFYTGVDNVADQNPPYGVSGTGNGGGIYENIGRFFYAGFSFKY